ncbi:MAG TPA: DEAD/DEAH box helicase [Hyphomicrobiaceae bacterium]|nr:DEAD/DEAH box helicase [Hyphomicrobiaceae bacterium]
MTKFSELGLAEPVLKALAEEGYETPTPIQAQAIPVLLKGADLLGIAQTGTGKTAAFALPLLTRITTDKRPAPRRGARILVLSPTRELAAQIGESFRTYGRHLGTSVAVVFGGVAHKPQINALSKGVDVLVATPGRLIDHMETGAVTLEGVEALVLDEADQMLDLGFVRPIRRIVSKLRARRQNLFFSATMPHEIAALAAELLHEPVRVQVTPVATTAERVAQRVIHIEATKKRALLASLFADEAMSRTLVFTRTKRGADRVARHLDASGIAAVAIHGNKSQRQREVALDAFRSAKTGVLVATDIAARGIDIDGVTHVVNYELPEVPEAYVHRIGRTARAGAEGNAISLCDAAERDLLRAIERLTRQQIPAEDRRNDASIAVEVRERPAREHRAGERPWRGERHEGAGQGRRSGAASEGRKGDGGLRKPRRADNGAGRDGAARDGAGRDGVRHEDGRRGHGRRDDSHRDNTTRDTNNRDSGYRNARRRDDRPSEGERAPWTNSKRERGPRHGSDQRSRQDGWAHGGERSASRDDRAGRGEGGGGHNAGKPHRNRQSDTRGRNSDGSALAHVFGGGFAGGEGRKDRGSSHRQGQDHGQGRGQGHGHGGKAGKPHHRNANRQGKADGGEGAGARSPRSDGGGRRRRNGGAQARRLESV